MGLELIHKLVCRNMVLPRDKPDMEPVRNKPGHMVQDMLVRKHKAPLVDKGKLD
jgi:hypothetical protein